MQTVQTVSCSSELTAWLASVLTVVPEVEDPAKLHLDSYLQKLSDNKGHVCLFCVLY